MFFESRNMSLQSAARISLALFMFAAIGCQSERSEVVTDSPMTAAALESLTEEQEQQKEVAMAARDQLFTSLLHELVNSMAEKGPAKSISVCKTRAPEVAAEVGNRSGVRIGRTSFKLRNDANQPPAWARQFVDEKIADGVMVELPGRELGVLLPIHLKSTCLLCHGSNDEVMPDVRAAIVSNYPDDQATGFAEGDLRGYFWVEVPSPKAK
jgi:hypothetical protein